MKQIQIHYTKDYSLFKFYPANRPICTDHIRKLAEDITFPETYGTSPIIVSPDYFIIDGQHRFETCKKLNLGIYYIISETSSNDPINEIVIRNAHQKRWELRDYLSFYKKNNIDAYVKYSAIIESNKCHISLANHIFTTVLNLRHTQFSQQFKNGKLDFKDQYNNIKEIIDSICEIYKDIKAKKGTEYLRPLSGICYVTALTEIFLENKDKYYRILQKMVKSDFEFPVCNHLAMARTVLNKANLWRKAREKTLFDVE
jgi:hypothetical protein